MREVPDADERDCSWLPRQVADDDRAHRHPVDARPQIVGADALGERRLLLLGVQGDDDLVSVELVERILDRPASCLPPLARVVDILPEAGSQRSLGVLGCPHDQNAAAHAGDPPGSAR